MKSLLFVLFAIMLVVCPIVSQAQIPRTISYQGVLSDTAGYPKKDSTYSITFRLYQASSGGSAVWTETKSLQTKRGLFSTQLGDVAPFSPSGVLAKQAEGASPNTTSITFDKQYWMSIQVGTDPELAPRTLLSSVPYSMNSIKADTAKYSLAGAGTSQWTTLGSDVYYNTGKVGIGMSTAPSQTLDVNGNIKIPATTATSGIIYQGSSRLIHSYGTDNFFAGANAGNFTMTGSENTASGSRALQQTTSGYFNTASGVSALFSNTTGYHNTANGHSALVGNISGNYNTANGYHALFSSNGNANTGVGWQALSSNTTGSNNTAVGYLADVSLNNLTNATAIGYNARVGQSNSLVLGGTGADAVKVGIGTPTPGATLDVVGTVKMAGFNLSSGFGNGKILTSDASGVGTWQTAPVGSQWTTTGSDIYYNSTGRVGIGTNLPETKLDILGELHIRPTGSGSTLVATDYARFYASNPGGIYPNDADGHLIIQPKTSASRDIVFATSYGGVLGPRAVIAGSGNVGIGTTSPQAPLDVAGFTNGAVLSYLQNPSTGGSAYSAFRVGQSITPSTPQQTVNLRYNNSGYLTDGWLAANQGSLSTGSLATGGLAIATQANAPILFATSGLGTNERMRITGTGRVGIGTSSPRRLFHVAADTTTSGNGDSLFFFAAGSSGKGGSMIFRAGNGATTGGNFEFRAGTGTSGHGGDLTFRGGGGYSADNGYIRLLGNVGIGVLTPGAALDVAGTVKMTGFNLSTGAGSGKMLTSDASGVGTWQTAPTGSQWTTLGSDIYYNSTGRVGIGTTPSQTLDVNGNIKIPATTPTSGIIYQGTSRLIHSYGVDNFFAGVNAGNFTITGIENTAIGSRAFQQNTSGNFNTACGVSALFSNATGYQNTANGHSALVGNISGNSNTADGYHALYSSNGNANTAVGWQTLASNTAGSNNTAIGYYADVSVNSLTNATAIGYNAKVGQSNSLVLGGTGSDAVKVGIGTTTPGFPLSFSDVLGDKISLYGQSGNTYGFGVQNTLLQIHSDISAGDIAFGYGSSASFTEVMRVKGTGSVGIGTTTPSANAKLDVENGSVLFSGTTGSTPSSGAGTRMMWIPSKSAFRAGAATGTEWDSPSIGTSSVAMGYGVTAYGVSSTALGYQTQVLADYSTAMGCYVQSAGTGSFIIGDKSTTVPFQESRVNALTARFAGGYYFYSNSNTTTGVQLNPGTSGWSAVSDRNKKENFRAIDGEELLSKIRAMSITEWNYKKADPSIRYIGPVAQDFYAAFHLGGSDSLVINSICIDGVNMAGVQALEKRTAELREKVAELAAKTAELETVKSELTDVKARLVRLEAALTNNNVNATVKLARNNQR